MVKLNKNKIKNKKNKAYFIGGISGSGKSAVLKNLEKLNQRFQIIHGSEYFMKWLGLKTKDYNKLQSLPHDFKNKELNKMMQYLINNYSLEDKSILISAHYLRIIKGEISDAVGDWISLFDGLFFIDAEPKIILERLENNFLLTGRYRNIFPQNISKRRKLDLLYTYQAKTLEKVKKLSKKFNIPFFVIKNNLSLKEASDQLVNYLNNFETKTK